MTDIGQTLMYTGNWTWELPGCHLAARERAARPALILQEGHPCHPVACENLTSQGGPGYFSGTVSIVTGDRSHNHRPPACVQSSCKIQYLIPVGHCALYVGRYLFNFIFIAPTVAVCSDAKPQSRLVPCMFQTIMMIPVWRESES